MISYRARVLALFLVIVTASACTDSAPVAPDGPGISFAKGHVTWLDVDPTPAALVRLVETTNAMLAERGIPMRINAVWPFTVGRGTDPFKSLRTGSRWAWNPVTFYLDEGDFTPQLPSGDVESVLVDSYEKWNGVKASSLRTERITPNVGNVDIFDGKIPGPSGPCEANIDFTAEVWGPGFIEFEPAADIVVGGWLPAQWFIDCLGNPNILGVTFSISFGDGNADNYLDRLYVEQYYNEGFTWLTEGATFLGPLAEVDLESIAVHENGHSLGLGHYGGAGKVNNGTLRSGNFDMIFSPQAVMNPGYLGGEKRTLFSIDEAALRTLY